MKLLSIVLIVLILTACGPMWEDGKYEVYYIDGHVSLGIKLDESGTFHRRVGHKVVAVGADENYIVAKQVDSENIEYSYFYIIRKNDDKYLNPDEITQGPYTELQFSKIRNRLSLPKFSKEF
jgi:hypothetical protein